MYLPEYISKFIRDENRLTISRELHRSRLFREFAIQVFHQPLTVFLHHFKKTHRSLNNFNPSNSQTFNILSSPAVIKYLNSLSTAAHLTWPDLIRAFLCSSSSMNAVEWRSWPVLFEYFYFIYWFLEVEFWLKEWSQKAYVVSKTWICGPATSTVRVLPMKRREWG